MDAKFESYLSAIEAPSALKERVDFVLRRHALIMAHTFDDILVTNTLVNGAVNYQSLWAFTANTHCETKSFISEYNIDFISRNRCCYVSISEANFDLVTAGPTSSLAVEVNFGHNLGANLNAAGKNCEYLLDITKRLFVRSIA